MAHRCGRGVTGLWARYNCMVNRHPILMQSLQTGVIMGTGDIIAQTVVERQPEFCDHRLAMFAGLGFFVVGPVLSKWYRVLEYLVPSNTCSSPMTVGVKKMALDQLIMAPTLLATVIGLMEILKGNGIQGSIDKLQNTYPTVLRTNYKIWPFVQFVNFTFVPLNLQVAVNQTVAVAWNTYLSYKINEKK